MATIPWMSSLRGDPLSWLLEADPDNPGPRYFTLVDLLDEPRDSAAARTARQAVMQGGPVEAILEAQAPEGYWVKPGAGYGPKYQGTVWSVCFLAQLGADGEDARVKAGCQYVLEHSRAPSGRFSVDGTSPMVIHCLDGNLSAALIDLGWLADPRLQLAVEWLARSITGEGIAPAGEKDAAVRYYRSGNSGPGFACSANNHMACAWGAVKAAIALSKIPAGQRSGEVARATAAAAEFLLAGEPARANYPSVEGRPSRSWFQFGYPLAYVTDVLQTLEALVALGCSGDARVQAGAEYVLSKQDPLGRWKMEYTYNGKTWADVEQKGQPSKWVTLRALRVIKGVYGRAA